jgi:hypothetical protein
MYTLFICIGLFLIFAVVILVKQREETFGDVASSLGLLLFGCFVLWFFSSFVAGSSNFHGKLIYEKPIKENVYSLNLVNEKSVGGVFILGVGGFHNYNNIEYIMYKECEGG